MIQLKLVVVVLVSLFSLPVMAETIKVPVGHQTQASGLALPNTGMSKAVVADDFGEPLRRTEPVGQPPISRWVYDDYTVFFEYDRVIHSVAHP